MEASTTSFVAQKNRVGEYHLFDVGENDKIKLGTAISFAREYVVQAREVTNIYTTKGDILSPIVEVMTADGDIYSIVYAYDMFVLWWKGEA